MSRPLKCECGGCNVCKARERQRWLRENDPEHVRALDNARYQRDKPKRRAAADAYFQTPAGKAARGRAAKGWRERNPEARRAQEAVGRALRDGKLVRGSCCREGADCSGKIEAHHEDYSKPLEVVWACVAHHDVLDAERRERDA